MDDVTSIIITNYNYDRYLRAAVDSALNQIGYRGRIEVIVVDDGSTDSSLDILAEYGDRVTVIRQQNLGQPAAINRAVAQSTGSVILFCDADDVFAPEKAAKIAEIFNAYPTAGWVYHELPYIGPQGEPLPFENLPPSEEIKAVLRRREHYQGIVPLDLRDDFTRGVRLSYICPAMSGLCFRRETLTAVLPIPESIAMASDEFPKFAALALYKGVHLGEPLAMQRLHDSNAATYSAKDQLKQSKDAIRYIRFLYHLRKRFPVTARSADKWFTNAAGTLIGQNGLRRAFEVKELGEYLREHFGLVQWLTCFPRLIVHTARQYQRRTD